MKRISWKTALVYGLVLGVGSPGFWVLGRANAQQIAQAGKGGGKGGERGGGRGGGGGGGGGGDKPSSNRGAHSPNMGGAGAQRSRGGDAPRAGGRSGMHAPSIAGPRPSVQPPMVHHAPSFSRPNVGYSQHVSPSRIDPRRPPGVDPIRSPLPGDRYTGPRLHGDPGFRDPGFRGTNRVGTAPYRAGAYHSSIVNRPFVGNTVNYNDRHFNVGHSSYQPAYYRHSVYHGYWNGNRNFGRGSGVGYGLGANLGYGGIYGPGWGWGLGNAYGYGGGYSGLRYRPFGWGLGGWGLGSLIYNSGYLGYSNPYYVAVGSTGYNYSQPIPVSYNASMAVADSDPNSADEVLNNAVAAFKQNDYDGALDITDQGIAQYPDDAVLHEFRALVLFAKHDYQQAAATMHSVLAVGPGWDWTTLSSMYASVATYTEQLRALEAFAQTHPQDAASRFLLGYHRMSCGHPDVAARDFQRVVKLMPSDRVAADLLRMLSAPPAGQAAATGQAPTPSPSEESTRPTANPIDPATLTGAWKASRADGSKFKLTLTRDASFTWSFSQKDQAAQEFGGSYSVEGNVLALERKDGGSLIAEVVPGGDAKFNFKLLGAPDDDPGLDFSR